MDQPSTQKSHTWTDRHQALAEELSSWIPRTDVRQCVIVKVRDDLENYSKPIGDLDRWFRRTIQSAFFTERLCGREWSAEHVQFVEACTTWISDPEIRKHVVTLVQPRLQQKKTPPKDPAYWMRRVINAAFRTECKNQGIPTVNQWTDETWELTRKLTIRRHIPDDIRDSIISQVWRKFVGEVEPIEKLENWLNKTISSEYDSEITAMTGKDELHQWQVLRQDRGTKQQVDTGLARTAQEESAEESPPGTYTTPHPENKILLDTIKAIHVKEGPAGRLSQAVIELHWSWGYTDKELAERFDLEPADVGAILDHDHIRMREIAEGRRPVG